MPDLISVLCIHTYILVSMYNSVKSKYDVFEIWNDGHKVRGYLDVMADFRCDLNHVRSL